jgi:hypothetical protein
MHSPIVFAALSWSGVSFPSRRWMQYPAWEIAQLMRTFLGREPIPPDVKSAFFCLSNKKLDITLKVKL